MNTEQPANNPYAVPDLSNRSTMLFSGTEPQRVPIQAIEIIKRAWNMIREQYGMILLTWIIAWILGSLVPMNVLLGAMIVGFYLCLLQVERGEQVEIATLFKSFDQFLDSLIVIICFTVLNFIVVIPLVLAAVGIIFASILTEDQQPPGIGLFVAIFGVLPIVMVAAFLTFLPFLFSFQLIADRKLGAIDSIKLSWKAVWMNLGGILVLLIVLVFLHTLLWMMCILPGVLFMPIAATCFWVLYRDIFTERIAGAALQ